MPTAKLNVAATLAILEAKGLVPPGTAPAPKSRRMAKPVPLIAGSTHHGLNPAWIEMRVPVRLQSRANLDGSRHWRFRDRANKALKKLLGDTLEYEVPKDVRAKLAEGCIVRMTRIAPRRLDDDNNRMAAKGVRDLIAQVLLGGQMGRRDDDPRIEWRYGQERDGKNYGLRVQIWEASNVGDS